VVRKKGDEDGDVEVPGKSARMHMAMKLRIGSASCTPGSDLAPLLLRGLADYLVRN